MALKIILALLLVFVVFCLAEDYVQVRDIEMASILARKISKSNKHSSKKAPGRKFDEPPGRKDQKHGNKHDSYDKDQDQDKDQDDDDYSQVANYSNKKKPSSSHYQQEQKKPEHHYEQLPTLSTPKYLKLCTYVGLDSCTGPASCLLVENSHCFTLPNDDSVQVNLVGEQASVVYYHHNPSCNTAGTLTTDVEITLNQKLDTCFADSDRPTKREDQESKSDANVDTSNVDVKPVEVQPVEVKASDEKPAEVKSEITDKNTVAKSLGALSWVVSRF